MKKLDEDGLGKLVTFVVIAGLVLYLIYLVVVYVLIPALIFAGVVTLIWCVIRAVRKSSQSR